MINTVLVPMDRSEHARNAAAWALEIAAAFGARIVFMHVFQPGDMTEELRELAESEHLERSDRTQVTPDPKARHPARATAGAAEPPGPDLLDLVGRSVLGEAAQAARKTGATEIATRVAYGDPAREIIKAAGQVKADLIVMGRRGLSDIEGLVMGSVAHKVASHCACACLTVK